MASNSTQSQATPSTFDSQNTGTTLPPVSINNRQEDAEPLMKAGSENASPVKVQAQGSEPLTAAASVTLAPNQSPVTLQSGRPLKSILKTSKVSRQQSVDMGLVRKDTAGKNIGDGERFKIAFRDKVQQGSGLADVHWVESYKKYNQMDVEEETTICKCTIF